MRPVSVRWGCRRRQDPSGAADGKVPPGTHHGCGTKITNEDSKLSFFVKIRQRL